MKKYFLIAISLILCIFSFAFVNNFYKVNAEQKQNIIYVSFGDSIAEGYAFNLKTKSDQEALITGGDSSYDFVNGCYADLIRQELNKTYNVTAYNYAYSGDTCQDLINFLSGFYDTNTNSVKDPTNSNSIYSSLTNQQVFDSVIKAGRISICIGANNILEEATDLIPKFLGFNSPEVSRNEIESKLRDKILGDNDDIKGFQAEFSELLRLMNTINPNAKIYITNVYNPYKSLIGDKTFMTLAQSLYPKFTQKNLDILSEITEVAISGGKDSNGNDFIGINNIILNGITNINDNSNFKYVDTKYVFDTKYDGTSLETKRLYNNYVNTDLEKLNLSTLSQAEYFFDPHPTSEGHNLIFSAHQSVGLDAFIDSHTNPQFDYSVKINNSDVLNKYTLYQNQSLEVLTTVQNDAFSYDYTYTIKNDETVVKTYSTNPSTINYSDIPNGTYKLYLTIKTNNSSTVYTICEDQELTTLNLIELVNVTINSNGGIFTNFPTNQTLSFTVEKDSYLNEIDYKVTYKNHTFISWLNENGKWDFSNKITTDIRLSAQWQENPKVVFDLNGAEGTVPDTIWADSLDGQTITVPKNVDAKYPGHIFWQWNTSPEGNGFGANETFNLTSDTKLYAIWMILKVHNTQNGEKISAQHISELTPVNLLVDIVDEHNIVWNVLYNDTLIQSQNGDKRFSFMPSQIGEYKIYATVDGVDSSYYTIVVSDQKVIELRVNTQKLSEDIAKDNGEVLVYLCDYITYDANFDTTNGTIKAYQVTKDNTFEIYNAWILVKQNCYFVVKYTYGETTIYSNKIIFGYDPESSSGTTEINPDDSGSNEPNGSNEDKNTKSQSKDILLKCSIAFIILLLGSINVFVIMRKKDY